MGAGSCHWECLNLSYPSFQWTLLLVLMCRVGIFFLFCYLALVSPISGSVINLCYPFNDFTIHSVHKRVFVNNLQLFYWQENSVSSKDLQGLPQMFLFSLPQCQRTPVLFLCWKGSVPFACTLGSWILLLFSGLEQNRSIFLGKLCGKNSFRVLSSQNLLQKC